MSKAAKDVSRDLRVQPIADLLAYEDLQPWAWSATRTLREVAWLNGQWIKGVLKKRPDGRERPEGVMEMAEEFGRLANCGLVVLDGQPGADSGWVEDRAFVSVLCFAEDRSALAEYCRDRGLIVMGCGPDGAQWSPGIAVSRNEVVVNRSMYGQRGMIREFADAAGPIAKAEIIGLGHNVLVVDPVWGRDHLLRSTLCSFADAYSARTAGAALGLPEVMRRLAHSQEHVHQVVEEWISVLVGEVASQAVARMTNPRDFEQYLVVLNCQLSTDDHLASCGDVRFVYLDLAGTVITQEVPAIDRHVFEELWSALNTALPVAMGSSGALSLIVFPEKSTVVGWEPRFCVVHDELTPATWYEVGAPSMRDFGGLRNPHDVAAIPEGVFAVLDYVRRWNIVGLSEPIVC